MIIKEINRSSIVAQNLAQNLADTGRFSLFIPE